MLVSEAEFIDKQLNECPWPIKFMATFYLFPNSPTLVYEVPQVIVRALPPQERKRFRSILPAQDLEISDTEDLLLSLTELQLTEPCFVNMLFTTYNMNGKDLAKPPSFKALRYAFTSILSMLTNRPVKAEEFIQLSELVEPLHRYLEWPAPPLPPIANTSQAQWSKLAEQSGPQLAFQSSRRWNRSWCSAWPP